MGWESLSDEDLVRVITQMADACVRIVSMTPEEREHVDPKRGASPNQAGALTAALVTQALSEYERRGLGRG